MAKRLSARQKQELRDAGKKPEPCACADKASPMKEEDVVPVPAISSAQVRKRIKELQEEEAIETEEEDNK